MKKLLSLSLMLSLGLATVTPALNAVAQSQTVAQSQANPADVSGWQAAKKWWRSGRNMKALNPQEQRAFGVLKKKFALGAIITAIVAIIGGGAAYRHRKSADGAAGPAPRATRPVVAPVAVAEEGSSEWELIDAAWIGDKKKVEELIAAGADVNAVDQNRRTALMEAAHEDHENIVKELLQVEEIDVNAADQLQETALILAAAKGHENIVKLLLDKGANRTMENMFSQTAEAMARENHEDLANMIRDYGNDK